MMEEELQTDMELEDVPDMVDPDQGPVDDPELADFLAGGEAELGDDEFEPVKLTLKQKLIVGATVIVSFIVLSLLYFPYDQIVRNVFMQSFPGSSINSIDLNLFGPDEFSDVRLLQGGGQIVVQAANVKSGLSWTGFLRNQLDGDLIFTNVRLNSPMADLEVSEAEADFDFTGLNLKHRFKSGTIAVVLKNIFLQRVDLEGLVGFPVDIDAEKIVIQEVKLGLRVENGTASVTEGILTSNVFNITATGNIDLDNDTLDFSRPSLNICMR
ncbi:MAG: hypothetical protein KDK27_07185, partial [Leptospiraceae bacterium]|nr:hypothetical protein [Leptospiraceae bacterium]